MSSPLNPFSIDGFDPYDSEADRKYERIEKRPHYKYHCADPTCGAGLRHEPTDKDPETGALICAPCYRFRTALARAREERKQNLKHSVRGKRR